MNSIVEKAKALEQIIIQDRRNIHKNPELGLDLPQTAAYVKKRLDEMGVSYRDCGGDVPLDVRQKFVSAGFPDMAKSTGVVATIGSGSPCILLRADMDALPIKEDNDLEFRSESNFGHMCGHDSHVAMLLGAAKILKDMEADLKGTVKLMFQPGEEVGIGAKTMVEDGMLENPKVDAAMAIHVQSQMEPGQVRFCKGNGTSSLDTFIVKIKGVGGHSSQPQNGIDPLMIANQIYQAMNMLVGRESDPAATVTLTCGVLKGGTAVNIIPDEAEVHIGMRTLDRDARNHLVKRIPEIVDHYVKAWRGTYETAIFATPNTWVDPEMTDELLPFVKEVVGEENVQQTVPFSGTEDFGYVSENVPAMFLFMGAGKAENFPLHNPHMLLEEEAFATGAAIYANCAAGWLEKQSEK